WVEQAAVRPRAQDGAKFCCPPRIHRPSRPSVSTIMTEIAHRTAQPPNARPSALVERLLRGKVIGWGYNVVLVLVVLSGGGCFYHPTGSATTDASASSTPSGPQTS